MGRKHNKKSLTISDKIISKIAQRDSKAFEELYNKSSAAIFGLAMTILTNQHDAEDVVQETFISIYNNAHKYEGKGKAMAWIFTITRNHALQKIREKKKMSTVDIDELPISSEDNNVIDEIHKEQLVDILLKELKDDERQIVVMHAMSNVKHKDIAKVMNLPLSTVLSKYRRAIQKLKNRMEVNEYDK